jgi:hypothetical protein
VRLKDERVFEQVVVSENCIIEVRGYKEIPFAAEDVVSVSVTHQHWNFRDQSDSHTKSKAASA